MSINLDPFIVTAGVTQVIPMSESPIQLKGVKFTNRTVFDVTYNGPGHQGAIWVPSNTEYFFSDMNASNPGFISVTSYNTTNVSPAPTGIVLVTLYSVDEKLPVGTWPVSIPQSQVQSNVNNTTLVNTGNPSGTQVILITPAGSSGPTFSFLSDGTLTIATVVAGAPANVIQIIPGGTPILKLGQGVSSVEIENNLNVLNNLSVSGKSFLDGGLASTNGSGSFIFNNSNNQNLTWTTNASAFLSSIQGNSDGTVTYNSSGSNHKFLSGGNTEIADVTSGGILLKGAFNYDTGSTGRVKMQNGNTIQAISSFTGAATGTYNHNCGQTPFWVIPMQNVVGSQTMGYDSVTSTQVHVTSFSGASFKALCLS